MEHSEQKLCPMCKKPKSTDDFGKNKRHYDGLQSWCKKCSAENPEVIPRDWYEILPADGKKFLEEYPAVKAALKGRYIGADLAFINHLRRHLKKYRFLTEHQIDQAIAISQYKVREVCDPEL